MSQFDEGVETSMPDHELINEMIDVYRNLNIRLRGVDLNAIKDRKADNGESLVEILNRMRNREYNASQAIKRMSLNDPSAGEYTEDQQAVVLDELVATGVTPIIMLSQYGTAREATLSLLRTIEDETLDREVPSPRGTLSIREYCRALVNDDRSDEQLLSQLVEKAPA